MLFFFPVAHTVAPTPMVASSSSPWDPLSGWMVRVIKAMMTTVEPPIKDPQRRDNLPTKDTPLSHSTNTLICNLRKEDNLGGKDRDCVPLSVLYMEVPLAVLSE